MQLNRGFILNRLGLSKLNRPPIKFGSSSLTGNTTLSVVGRRVVKTSINSLGDTSLTIKTNKMVRKLVNSLGDSTLTIKVNKTVPKSTNLSGDSTLSTKQTRIVNKGLNISGELLVVPTARSILRAFDSVVNVGEANKKINVIYTKVGGQWKYAYVYTKVNGVWKEMT